MRDHKNEDRDYLNQFKDKSVSELMDILSTEAAKLKSMIKDFMNKASKNEKD